MIDLSYAVSPTQLAAALERDLSTPTYIERIERSRDDMFAGRMRGWREVVDAV